MLYFEDYLDTVESLPQELTRIFTQMKELDASAQTSIREIADKTQSFISQVKTLDKTQRSTMLKDLSESFKSALQDGQEKVALATQTYDMVDRHVRRLDDDLEKFERELSNARVGSSDRATAGSKRKPTVTRNATRSTTAPTISAVEPRPKRAKTNREELMDQLNNNAASDKDQVQSSPPASSTPVKRNSSIKSGSGKDGNKEKDGKDGGSNTAVVSKPATRVGERVGARRARDISTSKEAPAVASSKQDEDQVMAEAGKDDEEDTAEVGDEKAAEASSSLDSKSISQQQQQPNRAVIVKPPIELPVDPNEPTYCVCQQVSFGEMIACDNEDCEIEWFHYPCVDLDGPPVGKWYCPNCTAASTEKGKKSSYKNEF